MNRSLLLILLCVLLASCANIQLKHAHDIPVRNDYIKAGVQPGDSVEITLKDGEVRKFEVVDVRFNVIEGPDGEIHISDIQQIVKRSFQTPGHPCGGNEPLGCSIPEVVLLLSEEFNEQASKFHPACVTHDFCYRHGYVTYGETREQCDADFLRDMKEACGGLGGLSILDLQNYSYCTTAAQQTYNAVRLKGEPHFRTSTSSVCEYDLGR